MKNTGFIKRPVNLSLPFTFSLHSPSISVSPLWILCFMFRSQILSVELFISLAHHVLVDAFHF